MRTSEEPLDVDERVSGRSRIVYLSLGSLGCMDVGLMQRLIDTSGTTEDRVIVSMALKDQVKLGPDMFRDRFLPQPSILPQCDLLITHGGNNTTCEWFHFGLPMIGLPLFWGPVRQRAASAGDGLRPPSPHLRLDRGATGGRGERTALDDLAASMRAEAKAISRIPAG